MLTAVKKADLGDSAEQVNETWFNRRPAALPPRLAPFLCSCQPPCCCPGRSNELWMLKLLKKQRVNTKMLGATQAGRRIKVLAKHSKPDVAAAATAVIAAWKDAVRQEAADNTAATAGDGKAAASTAGGPASSRQSPQQQRPR
ncbi:hypothetical protein D9Q98_006933 [Chlorella vulgaris]|uniref:TFIIS N-terminal domain-containing protein n=1 Tax=Chlorella vulgaris TaxID=3077 RepID=A0A9D4TJA8_CHLVU|nr:hypothetical protein D9Q98_006933 [Chlorella vulgaris]